MGVQLFIKKVINELTGNQYLGIISCTLPRASNIIEKKSFFILTAISLIFIKTELFA